MTKPEQDGTAAPNDLIVIGSSAGGVEALSTLVASLPADFAIPMVVAQHLDASRPSSLGPILDRRSKIQVVVVEGTTRVQRGTIYVVPSNRHVIIADGSISLQGDRQERPRPSIDWLLSTAAQGYGERLIAVILTGSGTDGAAGAVEVKNAGGTVIIQDPQTARFPSMPLALPPTVVDHVVKLEELGALLYSLQQGMPPIVDQAHDPVLRILAQVSRLSNIDFRPYKPSTIHRRIARRAAITRCATLEHYADYLEEHPEETGELVMAFLIKVTEFFRDREAFDFLRAQLLPELIERGRERGRVLRFWSAGCATGEEPYSLAMLLADQLGSELASWNIKIFATDLDENAISFARRGLYPSSVLRSLPATFQSRFFETTSQGHHVAKTLRQLVIFGQQDLGRGVPFPRIDLVLCRNLLIYFNAELQRRVLDLFTYSVLPGGYLFLGHAEAARPARDAFELVNKQWKIYRCTKAPLLQVRPQPRSGEGALVLARGGAQGDGMLLQSEAAEGPSDEPEVEQLRRLNEAVLRLLPVGVVIIDRAYRVLTISGLARRLLNIPELALGEDFLHATRGLPYERLRVAIDTAFSQQTAVTLAELELESSVASERRFITLSLMTVQRAADLPKLAVVSVLDSTETVQTRQRLEAAQAEQQHLLGELSSANKRLGDLNKELQGANEELKTTNEELMVAQEEIQATNEEFETTNEELQATNEEFETNNEELQATNEELKTTNEELEARSAELQELAPSLSAERSRLSAMVELAPFFIMTLRGATLTVEAANQRYLKLFSSGIDPIGLPFYEVVNPSSAQELLELIREVAQGDETRTSPRLPVQVPGEATPRIFTYTLVPLHDATGKPDGVVVYGEDVSSQVLRETELREAAEQLAARKELERLDHLKDEFLALASHELRTPLVPLVVYSDLLDRIITKERGEHPALDPRLGEFVGKFRKQLRHLERLTDDLLDVARLQQGRFSLSVEPVELARLLAQAVEKATCFSDQPPIVLLGADDQAQPSPVVKGDEQRLLQVVLNLLRNALNYAASSDRIEVRLSQEQAAAQDAARPMARVDIEDHGPGIEPTAQEALFTRFYQESPEQPRSKSGLGLGLFIARSIVDQHGGTLGVRSTVGEGTTFTIRLPLASA